MGGGGKGGGWGGGGWGSGGGGGWGGGVDRGKMRRQAEQAACKDAKNERECDYFWSTQARIGCTPPYAPSKWKLQEEEQELFATHSGNVGINFDKYDDIPVEVGGQGSEQVKPIETFPELWERGKPLPDFLWHNLERCKYPRPTPIQKYAMPAALLGRDCMCCAQTGSGKTCAFLVPILSQIDEASATGVTGVEVGKPAAPKAVILAPTRELCSQIHLEARKLVFSSKVRASEVYGGVDAKPQLRELALGSDIVTATPGRLTDFINRGVVTMSQVYTLVLDEADRMLDMGFEPQIREIVQKRDMPTPQAGRMTLMFSATFPKEIQRLAQAFMRQYVWIGVGQVGTSADTIDQNFEICNKWQKEKRLKQILHQHQDTTLVFVAMKRTAASLVEQLKQNGIRAEAIHGDMEQPQREVSLGKFKKGICNVLVATDVAARGLDIPSVTHVINFDLPENIDDYVHRIGRTGRVGRNGWATSFYATEGNYANHKILGRLMDLFASKGKPVPDVLQQIARTQGMRVPQSKAPGAKGFGGQDARGGNIQTFKATQKGSPSGVGAGKGAGTWKSAGNKGGTVGATPLGGKGGNAGNLSPAVKATPIGNTAVTGVKRPLDLTGKGGGGAPAWKKGKW
eukprot:TRINITY_DN47987_c0_g1_i1.p1 TRINITY_DN47987_c0_g1~~TRINITY_DN47987_c0_g1_i1.p1  ORF type:complete len:627 (-),score=92.02 TRINITY_DN47987_c0_g1_i1:140-2020(-)